MGEEHRHDFQLSDVGLEDAHKRVDPSRNLVCRIEEGFVVRVICNKPEAAFGGFIHGVCPDYQSRTLVKGKVKASGFHIGDECDEEIDRVADLRGHA